ncbi:MAG: type I glutamate--ammonia ligase [bacterium]|nr:type I glutamate--ammonia ligase [bacterium]
MFETFEEASTYIEEQAITMIDLKFCDLWGRWHHLTLPAHAFAPSLIDRGTGIDGSSVGFKAIKEGDLMISPDLATGFLDPFWEEPTLSFICLAREADTGELFPHEPRSIARRAEAFLQATEIADASYWAPEFEFYLFDGVSFENGMNVASYRVDSCEGPWRNHELGTGCTIPRHGGYHAIPPLDHLYNIRSLICRRLEAMGVVVKYHHHEVGGPGQCEIETPMLPHQEAVDAALKVKYVTRMTAFEKGMTATFMPKPLYDEAGSGFHFHQNLWKDGRNLCYEADAYGCLSELGRFFIGGLLHHAGAVMAFTNPSTNSFRRLVPGYEAPVSAIYSLGNRTAAVRIPKYANQPHSARFEFRTPDGTCNPYLATAVQLLAGIDGIRHRRDPTALGFGPIDEDIFTWPAERLATIKSLPTSLDAALRALESDHEFLLEGEVFTRALIERWIEHKRREERQVRHRPHPYEMELYFDL